MFLRCRMSSTMSSYISGVMFFSPQELSARNSCAKESLSCMCFPTALRRRIVGGRRSLTSTCKGITLLHVLPDGIEKAYRRRTKIADIHIGPENINLRFPVSSTRTRQVELFRLD